jgi:hypothetical protein
LLNEDDEVRINCPFVRQVQISSFFSLRVKDSEFLGFSRSELLASRALLSLSCY